LNCPHFVRFTVVLPAVAMMLAGCANSSSSVANSNASANTAAAAQAPGAPAKQPQRFGAYGVSTTGYNTNLATAINSMVTGEDTDEPETKVAAATPAGPAPAGAPASAAKPAPGQPQLAQNQPPQVQPQAQPQEPPKSKAQVAEDNVPGLYGTPRNAQKDVVHWLLETTKDDQ